MDILIESTGNIEAFENLEAVPEFTPDQLQEDVIDEVIEEENFINEEDKIEEQNLIEEDEGENEEDGRDTQLNNEVIVPSGNDIINVYNYQTESLSRNIIDTPLNEYSIEESLLLYIFLALFVSGFVILVRSSVLKWS